MGRVHLRNADGTTENKEYDEGIGGASFVSGGTNLSIARFEYVRLGPFILFDLFIDAGGGGGSSSDAVIIQLPFTSARSYVFTGNGIPNETGTDTRFMITGHLTANSNQMSFEYTTAAAATIPLIGTWFTTTNGYVFLQGIIRPT